MNEVKRTKLGPASAYAIAVKNGFEGTEKEWLESLAAGEYADRTEGFQAQSEYASPVEYLRSLGIGSWKVIVSDSLYMAKIMESGAGTVIFEKLISDDGFLYDDILLNGKTIYSLSTESGDMTIAEYRVITDRNVQLAPDEAASGGVIPSVKKVEELIGNPSAEKAGYIPVVSARGILELMAVTDGEEAAY